MGVGRRLVEAEGQGASAGAAASHCHASGILGFRRIFGGPRRGGAISAAVLSLALALGALPAAAQNQRPGAAPLPPARATAQPVAPKTFQRADLISAARRYEQTLKRDGTPARPPLDRARRDADGVFGRGDMRAAATQYGSLALAQPQDAGVWLRLARSLAAIKPKDDENSFVFTDQALGAAYIAYRRAGTKPTEAEALALIGHIYAGRALWRAAMETMEASLAAQEVPAERDFYTKLREEHGFRLIDYSVDADQAAPRACVQFSEDLAPGTDFASFVRVEGMSKPAITAEERQICVEGLKHGERYTFRVLPGIPATTGETLRKQTELSLYVRDRAPSVRFTGRNYVLPRTGQKGIPIVSVNTRAVTVNVLRVADRALVPTALDGSFRQAIASYARERLAGGEAIKVFSGTLDVDNPLNEEVTTAIPVNEAVGKLQPGVYVMTAKPDKGTGGDDDYEDEATQWFIVSDLGLTAVSGADGVHVLVRSLGSAGALANVKVELVARSNEVLGTAKADADGHVRFDPGLARGPAGLEAAAVVARGDDGDYAFLSLKDAGFDLTDRGVAGREAPGALDAFLATERGVYRSGETVHLTALLRDGEGRAAPAMPLTIALVRPDGVTDRKLAVADQGAGGRTVDLTLLKGAMTGTWRIRALSDPKAPPVGETTFLLEDYVPDRVEFDLSSTDKALGRARPSEVLLEGRYLFGAPAADLSVEAESELRLATGGRGAFPGYVFGNSEEALLPDRKPIADVPRTDAKGRTTLTISSDDLPKTVRPLEVEAIVRLVEAGGRAVQRTFVLPVAPAGAAIGVKPLFSERVREGDDAGFDIVVAGVDDKLVATPNLKWQLSRIETRYQWYKVSGSWDYEPVKTITRVGEGILATTADGPARLTAPTQYGTYRLDLSGDGLPLTSLTFSSGYGGEATADTPDRLDLTLDKAAYASGDKLEATLTARMAGTATVTVMNAGVLEQRLVPIAPGANKVSFTVGETWGPGAYLVAFLHRPLDVAASRMPGRSIGVAWFSVNRQARTLKVSLGAPEKVRPNTTLDVPVKVEGLKAGQKGYVTVAAVDVGILNLNRYQPPAPDDAIFGQRRLSPEIRDLYGALIDGMRGTVGRLRSGGDGAEEAVLSSPPSGPPLALFSGIAEVGPDGTAHVRFDLPAFDGTVRLMAMAWSQDQLGHGSADVVVRDKMVVLATLPRFLASGDTSSLNLDLTNVEAPAGDYRLQVTATGTASVGQAPPYLSLPQKGRTTLRLALTGRDVGPATVTVRVTGPEVDVVREFAFAVRPAYPSIERRTVRNLAAGESLTLSDALLGDLIPGSGRVAVSATPSSSIDVPALLTALDRYPYGCSEQVVSRALPLLYYNEVSALVNNAPDAEADERIRDAVVRVLARQASDGAFGLWSASGAGGDTWLDAYVADFLTRAKEKGFAVPDAPFALALDQLRNAVNIAASQSRHADEGIAYALYVLARNGLAPLGDLRYIADTRLNDLSSPLARGQVAAALALLGDRGRAERAFNVALTGLPQDPTLSEAGRADYGSLLRDAAALTALAREAGLDALAEAAMTRVDAARTLVERTSTQENAWLILAARSLVTSAKAMAIEAGGHLERGPFGRTLSRADLIGHPLLVRNAGQDPVKAVVSVFGSPAAPEPAISRGITLTRSFFTLDGKPADPARAKQNDRFVVVLRAEEEDTVPADILLVDYLPAGFEIENPNLASGGEQGNFAWLDATTEARHAEFRDDRFVAAVKRQEGDDEMVLAYVVRAVSPGSYAQPPATIEDMYRPDRFARTEAGRIEVAPAQ